MHSFLPQWFHDLDATLSVLGFVLTFLIFNQVREVKRSFKRKALLPGMAKDLAKYATALSTALSAGDLVAAKTEIASAHHRIKAAKKLLDRDVQGQLKQYISTLDINRYIKAGHTLDTPYGFDRYSDMHVCIRILEQATKSGSWE